MALDVEIIETPDGRFTWKIEDGGDLVGGSLENFKDSAGAWEDFFAFVQDVIEERDRHPVNKAAPGVP